jgi:hypothetical protein
MAGEEKPIAPETRGREDWTEPPEQRIPQPTYAPAAMALGTAFVFFGIVTSWLFCVAGGVLIALSLKSWIGGLADGD